MTTELLQPAGQLRASERERIVIPVTDPIIIGNAPSSGSSLLRVLLSRLPNVVTGGELGILDKPALFEFRDGAYRRSILRWLDRGYPGGVLVPTRLFAQLEGYPFSFDEVREICADSSNHRALVTNFFRQLIDRSSGHRWLEKSPGNVYAFRQLREVFPTARFVHIVRDGRDCTASLVKRGYSPFLAVTRWYCAALAGYQCRSWPGYCEIRYEDLVRNPRHALPALCKFLGESFCPTMLAPNDGIDDKDPAWRNDHNAAVSTSSLGRHEEDSTAELAATFHAVRLSKHGQRFIAHDHATILPTPDGLQRAFGYESFPDASLDAAAVNRARSESRRWLWRSIRHFGAWSPFPTMLKP